MKISLGIYFCGVVFSALYLFLKSGSRPSRIIGYAFAWPLVITFYILVIGVIRLITTRAGR